MTGIDRVEAGDGDDRIEATPGAAVACGAGTDVALGLPVPGAYGDCETVFETNSEVPYLTVERRHGPQAPAAGHARLAPVPRRRQRARVTAAGVVELRHRGRVIARGRFSGAASPAAANRRPGAQRARPRAGVPLGAQRPPARRRHRSDLFATSRSAIRRDARLPRIGRCAQKKARQR